MKMSKFAAIALLAVASIAFAANPAPECEGLKIATGPSGKGYSKLYANIAKVCGQEVPVCEVTTTGGLDNLSALSTKDADIGIAAIDTLMTMKQGDENIAGLLAVAGLNSNYLHVITAINGFTVVGEKKFGFMKGDAKQIIISRFTDLKGQRIAVVGSAQLLGRSLERQLRYEMQFIDVDSDDKAFDLVKRGEVAAAFTVSGWPSGTVNKLAQSSGLTMVPYDAPATAPYTVRSLNYKNMGVYNSNALGVPNLLLTRPFKGDKAQDVAKLKRCLSAKLLSLQEGSFEPGWNEIKNIENTYDWPKADLPSAAKKK